MNSNYNPKDDPTFEKPYIDTEEWREVKNIKFYYVHGGFEDTQSRFAFFFPEKEQYGGRFFQFMSPAPENENAAIAYLGKGAEDKIRFALTHGAYYVESNLGGDGFVTDPSIQYRTSAATAEFSRTVAVRLFGAHRPFGYVYGGSGGGFKTMGCIENSKVWDGAVPYVIGSPMALPNVITSRGLALRVLRDKFRQIADALEPGGSGDPYENLSEEETAVLKEVTRLGFPIKVWFGHEWMDDGSLECNLPIIKMRDPQYFTDFWTKPGYAGYDGEASTKKDRIKLTTSITEIKIPEEKNIVEQSGSGVDEAWRGSNTKGYFEIGLKDEMNAAYIRGTRLLVMSGASKGSNYVIEQINGNYARVRGALGSGDIRASIEKLQPGDLVLVDNSDYIASQTYHRHQIPEQEDYTVWNQFKDENGIPLYPQRESLLGPGIARTAAGSIQTGDFDGKVIVVACLYDESAFPWQADWYRTQVKKMHGGKEDSFRLWYVDKALHGDVENVPDPLHLVSYLGVLYQALLDVCDWVEKGIEPCETTGYVIKDGQIEVSADANVRKGIQPVIDLFADGEKCIHIKSGASVKFEAIAKMPPNAGGLTGCGWSFEEENVFAFENTFLKGENDVYHAAAEHQFEKPGTYYVTAKAYGQRNGDRNDIFTQTADISRVRVIVE